MNARTSMLVTSLALVVHLEAVWGHSLQAVPAEAKLEFGIDAGVTVNEIPRNGHTQRGYAF